MKEEVIRKMIDLIHMQQKEFGLILAHEKLIEVHTIKISAETVQQIMIAEKLWKSQ